MTSNQPTFRPWISNLIMAFYGSVAIWISHHFLFKPERLGAFAVAIAICSFFIVYQLKQFFRRYHGQRVEKKALRALSKAIERTKGQITLATSVPLKRGGDADAVVNFNGVKINIEIKSMQTPSKVTARHADQAARAGKEIHSIPIIWLPRATVTMESFKNGTKIFAGDAKSFVKFLGNLA